MRALFISVLVVTLASAAPQKEHHIAKRSGACHLPPYPAHGTYDVVGSPNAKPGDNVDYVYLNVTCSKGYGVIAKSVVICVNGEWSVKMPQCEKLCHLAKHLSVDYYCQIPGSGGTRECNEYEPSGTVVEPHCKSPNYYAAKELAYMRCIAGSWDYIAFCTAECGRVTPMAVPLISDGRPAIYNELPWHAAVYRKQHAQYIFACGGSLVSNTIVISAAHCFWNSLQNKVQPASDFAVGLGKLFRPWNDERDKDAQYSAVKDIKIPPRYQGRRTHFQEDLAVLILETSIVYKPYIRPVCLSFDIEFDRSQLQSGRMGKISGWGLTSADGDDAEILQMTELTYVSIEQCLSTVPKEFYPYIAGDKICAGYTNGTALCKGDTGGGLVFPEYERGVVRHYLRGIVSVALADDNPCNVNSVIGFTHVLKHESFIKEVQNDCANGWDLTGLRCKKLEQSNVQPTSSRPLLDDKCVLPPYPDHGTYQMHNAPFAAPGQGFPSLQLTVNCKPGYSASGNSILFCQDGFWSGDMPTCVRLCKLDQHPSVQYHCLAPDDSAIIRDCNAYEPMGTIVRPECNSPNYYTSYLLPDMKCVDGGWNYVAICTPECGRVTPESVELMIGGRSAYRGELPWHAGIYSQKQGTYTQICGGSLVSNTVVISAAHCFWKDVGKKQPASNYAVAVGKLYQLWDDERDADAQKSDIKSIETPSRFRGRENNFQEDIAILILKTTIVYQTYVRPVCLNFDYNFDRRQLQHSKLGKVAGWGLTTENGNSSEILKVVELPYVDIDQCLKKLPLEFREHITSDKICAGYTNGTAPCRGDSGGGLSFAASDREVDRFFLRGIVSVAPTSDAFCNAYTYTAFTHLLRHEHFVKRELSAAPRRKFDLRLIFRVVRRSREDVLKVQKIKSR